MPYLVWPQNFEMWFRKCFYCNVDCNMCVPCCCDDFKDFEINEINTLVTKGVLPGNKY